MRKICFWKALEYRVVETIARFISCFFGKSLRVCEIRYIFAAAYEEIAERRWKVRKLFDKIGKSKASKLG